MLSIKRVVLATVAIAAMVGGVAATSSGAATTTAPAVSTGAATGVTSTAATLNGVVGTGGNETTWAFQYGTSTKYTSATPAQVIPAGKGNVAVSATISSLKPFTTYHYRLVAVAGGSFYYYLNIVAGADRTFTTSGTGRLLLNGATLPVSASKHTLKVTFKCQSSLPCKGKFSVVIRHKLAHPKKYATIVVTDGRTTGFSIAPGAKKTITVGARAAAIAVLQKAKSHAVQARLSSYPRTGQHALIHTVELKLTR